MLSQSIIRKKIKCSECSAEFSRNDSLAKHIKSFHPKESLAPIPMDWVEEVEREEKLAPIPMDWVEEVEREEKLLYAIPSPVVSNTRVTPRDQEVVSAFNKRLVENPTPTLAPVEEEDVYCVCI